ncbi:MAG: tRNA preQ1(34) S-adenosylmethionine ribosyltransferase-isomerase QueA [Gammaproteobacteria bacterium]|jgi:S-adenosylmethionine:tRNA ribosyltransferase-isomerase|nr:tRNA preQ1(34) S-adenosylmethionine ribosyltransferase-isomerase QueA [Gammaproteobacteria bacterium]MBT3859054.1 tRNA preQ1(34) S-adenosylmethionine ribosyltransferase-isomerase QueA [Gammaproteobacteria bacterium]MBT3987054.1 tRNA preQ1(34) S-adenosylmethionine ribosyltransferase-isomerase QueA [Gammaproteobacteria bacterium]MBT4257261.1 tRNA preQ1(34) S-adenosylmethionine ribosyltransferase-isomerase QueA [Gammaproteobacteria bacterium]MBT4580681.1 tRNA preQ1(34) S-adenosylmethionine ribo
MQLQDFHFELPDDLIANFPVEKRSSSKLLCLDRQSGQIEHKIFNQLLDRIDNNDLLVFNNTRVIPARVYGHKESGGKIELLIERVMENGCLLAQIKASKSPKIGGKLIFADSVSQRNENEAVAEVIGREGDFFVVRFDEQFDIQDFLSRVGHMPLPPYIRREDEEFDEERYQTVYAKQRGAVAAPTAGLHFDDELLNAITAKGIDTAFLTLHVGAGTFQPIRVDNILEHRMHKELFELDETVCEKIKACKERGGRVIAVGTTSVRSLESAARNGEVTPFKGETDIFIYPGYKFQIVDAMITNFHLPESTLLMLVSAFCSKEMLLAAYQSAIENRYRFYSYGDAMFIA